MPDDKIAIKANTQENTKSKEWRCRLCNEDALGCYCWDGCGSHDYSDPIRD